MDHERSYRDLHEHLDLLAEAGLLIRVSRPIDKDSELHPLVRWQFRGGVKEADRKAFLFENVVDAKGTRYDIPVVVGCLAANREIYRIGLGVPTLDDVAGRWETALKAPVPAREVDSAPCQEIVILGDELDKPGCGLDGLPVPISTPGWDNGPYLTTSGFVTRDPDTGVQNMGNYRGQIKARRRLGMNPSVELQPGILTHWQKCRDRGERLPCAVVVGAPPVVTFASVQKLPPGVDELTAAGGLAGGPINVVRAKTVDIMVPAEAEVIIEGFIETAFLEPEAPFGESHGHVNLQEFNAVMEVTAITRRRNAILTSIISQVTPSESSLIKRIAYEPLFLRHLRDQLGIKGVKRVILHEPLTNLRKVVVVQFETGVSEVEIWRALYGAASLQRSSGKFVIAVNEDIDADNGDALLWALSYRMHPEHDLQILRHRDPGHGPRGEARATDASVLMNATLKGAFPPISLPKREYMERARAIWEDLGLPELRPQAPWFGYSLGDWPEEFEQDAQAAVRGDYFQTGEKIATRRRSDVEMNTEVR